MADYLIKGKTLIDIADAIRSKTGESGGLAVGDMADSISSIVLSGGINTSDATATTEDILIGETAYVNGVKIVGTHECEVGTDTSDATITSGAQMLSGVTAYGANGKVTGTIPSQDAVAIIPNNNSQVAISAGTYAAGDVTVEAVPTETKDIIANGTYIPQDGKYFTSVNVNIPAESFDTQSKTIAPSESQQVIAPDNGYDGLSSVTVGAIPSDYVGSGIVREDAKMITPTKSEQVAISAETYVSGDVVVQAIPDEYIVTTDATASAADILSDKTAYVNGSKITGTIPTQSGIVITPTKSSQVAIASGTYVSGDVTVEKIPDEYIVTSDATVSEEDIMNGKTAYANGNKVTGTFTIDSEIETQDNIISQIQAALEGKASNSGIDTSDATATADDIANGKTAYVNGVKITGSHECEQGLDTSDATATAEDILSGKTAYINGGKVTGSLVVNAYYVGNVEPSSSFGNDGDLYLMRGE